MRRILRAFLFLMLGLVGVVGLVLGEAHLEMQRLEPPLPDEAALRALAGEADGPVRMRFVDTATQSIGERGTIGHPSFVIEWADGRILLVDVGMTLAGAQAFSAPMEALLGADPIVHYGSVAELLGAATARVEAVAFSHLHIDHTEGLPTLCEGRARPLTIFQTPLQAERGNFTTRPSAPHVDEPACGRKVALEGGGPLYRVPGFPGFAAFAAAGHTPGSTVYAVALPERTFLLAGDVTNRMRALQDNQPKEWIYSTFIVPENRRRLEVMRTWLRDLDRDPGFTVLVAHDVAATAARGVEPFSRDPAR